MHKTTSRPRTSSTCVPPAPGEHFTPPLPEQTPDGPRIYSHNAEAGPDETFLLVGRNLTTDVVAWGVSERASGGEQWHPKVQFCTGTCLAATLPQRAYDGPFAVWVRSGEACSRVIWLNRPTCWWIMPDHPRPGEEVRVFGRNLTRRPDHGRPHLYLLHESERKWRRLPVSDCSRHQIRARIPRGRPPGSARLRVHTGRGGEHGWSNPLELTIARAASEPAPEFTLAVLEEQALRQALGKAEKAGGGTVCLPAGELTLRGGLAIGREVSIRGEGANRSVLNFEAAPEERYDVSLDRGSANVPIGMSTGGNKIEFDIDVPQAGPWTVHARYATEMSFRGRPGASKRTVLQVDDGEPVPLDNLPNTGSFEDFRWSRCATLELSEGCHRLTWRGSGGTFMKLQTLLLAIDPDYHPEETPPEKAETPVLTLTSEDITRFYADDEYDPPVHRAAVWLRGDGATLADLTVQGCPQVEAGLLLQHEDFPRWIRRCAVENVTVRGVEGVRWRNRALHLRYAESTQVCGCELWGQVPIYLSGIKQSTVAGNRLVCQTRFGSNANGAILGRQNIVRECAIEDNVVAAPPGREAGTPKVRRLLWLSTGHGSVAHNYIAGNHTGRASHGGVAGTDQNVGESMLLESCQRVAYFGPAENATDQSLVLPQSVARTPPERMGWAKPADPVRTAEEREEPFWPPAQAEDEGLGEPPIDEYYLTVLAGPGMGQTRRVLRRQGRELVLHRPWHAVPNGESTVLLSTLYHQNLLVGNTPANGMSGVQLWLGCVENVVAENEIGPQEGSAINLTACRSTLATSMPMTWNRGIGPTHFNTFEGNSSRECRSGVSVVATSSSHELPVEFPLSLGNVIRHNSFTACRRTGFSLEGQEGDGDVPGTCVGTLVEFNFVRDGQVGYRVGAGAELTVLRRNMAYFWYPVAPGVRSVAYDLTETQTCAARDNVVQGRCPNTGERVLREKRSED